MIALNFDNFLSWFPSRNFNWIYNWLGSGWHTETRYPLTSDKLLLKWADRESVVGVRFQSQTRYALLDIDSGSPYHPKNSAVNTVYSLEKALESIGINRLIWVRSSNSGGIHAYLPFPESVPTFKTAQLITQTLQTAGFIIKQGQLEIFPNPKTYSKFAPTNYNGHRLPLQPGTGSCLLTHNKSGGFDEGSTDINHWHLLMTEASKCHDFELLKTHLEQVKIDRSIVTHCYSSSAAKWRQNLEALVQQGWTASGQTNEILFNLLQLGTVFNSLEGEKLIQFMLATAQSMPNYERFCGHQHDIIERCSDWAKWNETHQKYKPYASQPDRSFPVNPPISSNDSRSIEAREKIARVVEELRGQIFKTCRQLLQTITDRAKQLFDGVGISCSTLYKFQQLWRHLLTTNADKHTDKSSASPLPPKESAQLIPSQSSPACLSDEGSVTPSALDLHSFDKTPKTSETPSTSTVTGNSLYEGFCSPQKNQPFRGGLQGGVKERLMNLVERVKNRSLTTAPEISAFDIHPPKNSDFDPIAPPENSQSGAIAPG